MSPLRRRKQKARDLFSIVNDQLDGAGLVVTDTDLLAQAIAEHFEVEPADVHAGYGGDEEPDETEG